MEKLKLFFLEFLTQEGISPVKNEDNFNNNFMKVGQVNCLNIGVPPSILKIFGDR